MLNNFLFNYYNYVLSSFIKKRYLSSFYRIINFLNRFFFYKLKLKFNKNIVDLEKKITKFINFKDICKYYNTDKSDYFFVNNKKHQGHNYSKFYQNFFSSQKDQKLKVVELGVQIGSSIAALHDYFLNSTIFAVDRNPFRIKFKSNRIEILVCDVSSELMLKNLSKYLKKNIDIIIDDSSHNPYDQERIAVMLFENLNAGGCLVIEELNYFKLHTNYLISGKSIFFRDILFAIKKKDKKFLFKFKKNKKLYKFIKQVKKVDIFNGNIIRKNINISEIAFIQKK